MAPGKIGLFFILKRPKLVSNPSRTHLNYLSRTCLEPVSNSSRTRPKEVRNRFFFKQRLGVFIEAPLHPTNFSKNNNSTSAERREPFGISQPRETESRKKDKRPSWMHLVCARERNATVHSFLIHSFQDTRSQRSNLIQVKIKVKVKTKAKVPAAVWFWR